MYSPINTQANAVATSVAHTRWLTLLGWLTLLRTL
jgi:hypothetical protein